MGVISRLNVPHRVIGLMPATDNKPDAKAINPGDIIRMHSGATVEVDNTDAEGRLILADALSYGIKKYKPDFVIDLATLTGACLIALGLHAAGLYVNEAAEKKGFLTKITQAGEMTYERVWQMPLYDEYKEQILSSVADIKNAGDRYAGSVTAAKFLEHFVDPKVPWAHLDIAGTAMSDKPIAYSPKGGTGYGVRLLVEFLKSL